MMFSGFKSLYAKPIECRYPNAGRISIMYAMAWATGSFLPLAGFSDVPPTYSITM